ncbi:MULTISPECIES: sirohydrochlorin chelatase [unclassified Candidatus Frackibacter]|uniref:sirohydrochlorin chelatase n=1 Tax=unclassified Candidatus Frackibacter TaxID=2648818 RepID=UPI000797EF4B|nr:MULTISPECIES: CbiX/SirB N-terminal domain-containing protein [unclassified Candidatus Frackibacter]KXS43892.1 MAG: cobalamin (vitamin B12) biosynthesis CbiX protein [Candidatus Frackibacter sp. T328-2]SDC34025.1 CbiX protein [Candidatus Frackibacter sp. WG11]SEM57176.1 CbiX protein [Candidatus Frackibacter sp. WG12]SFL70097.1 CbiX protein [Candidatus Frackibacter sp. WG13]
MKTGVVILGHGSKAEESNQAFLEFCDLTAKNLDYDFVGGGFLQFADPRLDDVIAEAVNDGVEKIAIMPLFLFPGNHVQKDIPRVLGRLKEEHPDVEFAYADHVGIDERLTEIVADRVKEVI